ncbi:uncharacterized protein LOC122056261 [Zingiber officinale]|uniref:Bromodomain associated domain-containing protein n=1 Tax=Zingiber officinale TaxID=94328 RepID=A0A8J5H1C2_ZINOF|nr:uncharacterized protein LOC122056261 [Zingiber officinale]KAG6517948.1 hypothetical protein ZIOFF_021348 [Zingiber officinale]
MAAALLGEDGRGYELARRLDGCGAWRAWLGDGAYAAFVHHLSSPASWETFMSPSPSSPSNSRAHLHLQLRVRALLFDKASAALFFHPASSPGNSAPSISEINPDYLQLHGDDIYYSLEDCQQDGVQNDQCNSRGMQMQLKTAFNTCKVNEHSYERASIVGPKYHEPDNVRHRVEDLPETWYNQFLREYRLRHHTFPYCDKEPQKRTPEGMSMFLKLSETQKRKRQACKVGPNVASRDSMVENGASVQSNVASDLSILTEEEHTFFPEMMFPSNCVPGSAIPPNNSMGKKQKIEVFEVLDNLPTIISRNPAMIERFGLMSEYYKMGKYRGKDSSGGSKKPLGVEEASKMTHKVVASALLRVGFEAGSESSMEVFSEVLSARICKLGRILRLLSDSYKKQFSSIELLKMFLQTAGYGNVGILAELIKDGIKGLTQQTHQNVRMMQPQQNAYLQAQLQRMQQMHRLQQMQMLNPQNLAFQQHQQQLLRRQMSAPRGSVVMMDKDQPMVDVKVENVMESPAGSMFNALNKQQLQLQHLQLRQQMGMSNQHAPPSQQFKQISNVQLPQLQTQNPYGMRTPVKVEAFHELMGGDSTIKHDSEHSKLTPSQ